MKKKIFLFVVLILATAFILTACGDKSYSLGKKGHDYITEAGEDTYIAVEEGLYYVFNQKNGKKAINEGYTELRYINLYSEWSMIADNPNFFVVQQNGVAGYSIMNAEGQIIIASTTDMQINYATLITDAQIKNGEYPTYDARAILVDFVKSDNDYGSALYDISGGIVFSNPNGKVQKIHITGIEDGNDYQETFDGADCVTYADDEPGTVIKVDMFNKHLVNIYSKDFSQDIVYNNISKHDAFDGDVLRVVGYSAENQSRYDVITSGSAIYNGYTDDGWEISSMDGKNSSFAFGKVAGGFDLIKGDEIIYSASEGLYSTNYYNVRVESDSGKFTVIDYKGDVLLSNVNLIGSGYRYDNGDSYTYFGFSGATLAASVAKDVIVTITVSQQSEFYYERVTVNDPTGATTKFFTNGAAVKEYGAGYTYAGIQSSYTYKFATEDYIYYYNYITNTESVVTAQADKVVLGTGVGISFVAEKESKTVKFVGGAIGEFVPYTGNKIPGFSVSTDYFSLTQESFLYKLNFDLLTKETDGEDVTYTVEDTMYAYFMKKRIANDNAYVFEMVYAGYNAVTLAYFENYFAVSTRDHTADSYDSRANLVDKTVVYKVDTADSGAETFNKIADIAISNATKLTNKYLIVRDSNLDTDSIYAFDGKKILHNKYTVIKVDGELALVEYGERYGVYNLEKGKLVEKVSQYDADLLIDGYYMTVSNKESGNVYTIKNADGKIVAKDLISEPGWVKMKCSYDAETGICNVILYIRVITADTECKLLKLEATTSRNPFLM